MEVSLLPRKPGDFSLLRPGCSQLAEIRKFIHYRVDGDDIVICEEVTSPSADDLKKAKKVSVAPD